MNVKDEIPVGYTILFMLGAYAFGFNLHNIIHELGHAISIWIQGGKVTGFYFHPFNACLNFSTYVPNHILLYAGGAFIGGASTIIFPVLAWKFRSPLMVPLVMACSAGFISTSKWMLIAPFSNAFSDYSSMISLGVPAGLILLAGILYLIIGVLTLILYLPLLGIDDKTSMMRRLLIFELGILPYQLFSCIYLWLVNDHQPLFMLINLIISAGFLVIIALLSKWLPVWFSFFRKMSPEKTYKSHIVTVWAGVFILVAVMLLVSVKPEGIN